jgi:hypothetical protein
MARKKVSGSNLPSKTPPTQPIKSVQFDLFSQFLANDQSEVSNTVDYWERIPKYFFSTEQQGKLREPSGLARSYTYEYKLKNNAGQELPYKVKIQPALIEQPDGTERAFFPTKTEENIEEVLKKIFTEQNHGIHDPKNTESWVKFSYAMIRKELYRMGRGLRHDQIKHSLEVMSKCILTVYEAEREIFTGAILQDYCSVDRSKYLEDSEAYHVARLPVFISHAINTLQFRQFNYVRFMECGEQLTRYLYKRLINRFINANYMNDYHFMFSDIQQASGLLQQARDNDNRRKVIEALEELKTKKVIMGYVKDDRKEGRKIVDTKYTITAHPDFVSEQKAANKRSSNNEIEARSQSGDLIRR